MDRFNLKVRRRITLTRQAFRKVQSLVQTHKRLNRTLLQQNSTCEFSGLAPFLRYRTSSEQQLTSKNSIELATYFVTPTRIAQAHDSFQYNIIYIKYKIRKHREQIVYLISTRGKEKKQLVRTL